MAHPRDSPETWDITIPSGPTFFPTTVGQNVLVHWGMGGKYFPWKWVCTSFKLWKHTHCLSYLCHDEVSVTSSCGLFVLFSLRIFLKFQSCQCCSSLKTDFSHISFWVGREISSHGGWLTCLQKLSGERSPGWASTSRGMGTGREGGRSSPEPLPSQTQLLPHSWGSCLTESSTLGQPCFSHCNPAYKILETHRQGQVWQSFGI